jgi:host factor-I protein
MSQVSDPPALAAAQNSPAQGGAAQHSVQDVFLNHARRERRPVVVHLMGGQQLDARITSFDRFAVVVDVGGVEQLIFKHAIAAIAVSEHAAPRPAAGHPTSRQP